MWRGEQTDELEGRQMPILTKLSNSLLAILNFIGSNLRRLLNGRKLWFQVNEQYCVLQSFYNLVYKLLKGVPLKG